MVDSVKQTNIKLYILKITGKAIFTVYILAYQWLIGSAGGLGVGGGYKIEAVGTDVAFVNICTINKSKTTSACCLQALSLASVSICKIQPRERLQKFIIICTSMFQSRESERGVMGDRNLLFFLPRANWRRNTLFFFFLFNISTWLYELWWGLFD